MLSIHFVREGDVIRLVARVFGLTNVLTFIHHVLVFNVIAILRLIVN
jgi:hypothetical protein